MELFWTALLHLKQAIKIFPDKVNHCSFSENGTIAINEPLSANEAGLKCMVLLEETAHSANTDTAIFFFNKNIHVDLIQQGVLSEQSVDFLKKYLPLCFLSILAKKQNRTISIAHFAQTLDGKIATCDGDSKWIGGKENLIHAHRMRALCDGILIGNHTLKADNPSLTVRLVSGDNPKRIVIGTTCHNYNSLFESAPEKIIIIGKQNGYDQSTQQLDYLPLEKTNGMIPPVTILENLYQQKAISSVYIEGGAKTTSYFLNQNAIDVLQLHIAPMLFGSGKSAINLPIIQEVKQAIQFSKYQFHKIGSEIMFSGFLNGKENNE